MLRCHRQQASEQGKARRTARTARLRYFFRFVIYKQQAPVV